MLHSNAEEVKGVSKKSLLLPPDVLLECEEFVFLILDDPFEMKLRHNYEVCRQTRSFLHCDSSYIEEP